MKNKNGQKRKCFGFLSAFFSKIVRFLFGFVKLKSKGENERRKEYILIIILLSSISLLAISSTLVFLQEMRMGFLYDGVPFLIPFSALCIFLLLYFFMRKGYFAMSSHILITILLVLNFYAIQKWSIELPPALMGLFLVVAISSILVSSRFSFYLTMVVSIGIITFGFLHVYQIMIPDLSWQTEGKDMNESIEIAVMFWVVAILSWLSNRETEKSLLRAKISEEALKQERDQLEIRVAERTEELRKEQADKIAQLSKFIEFGKMSSGLFHDLVNHLSSLFLNLERVDKAKEKDLSEVREYLEEASIAKTKVEDFLDIIRKQLKDQTRKNRFSLKKEVQQTIQILSYKGKINGVEIVLDCQKDINLFGNTAKFNHVLINIINNAIDSYSNIKRKQKQVFVRVALKEKVVVLEIEDKGCGIEKENISKIFEPFFTTKEKKGTGIGLANVKEIIENEFSGLIKVESQIKQGTKFILELPTFEK